MRTAAILGFITCAAAVPAGAQSVIARVDVDSLSIGQRTTLVLYAVHDGARRTLFPDESPDRSVPPEAAGIAGDFELLRRRAAGSRVLTDGARLDSVVYEATTFAVDTAYVSGIVRFAGELDTLAVAGSPFMVPVRSFVPADAEDVRDLAPVAEFPRPLWPWLVTLAVAVAGLLLWRRLRSRASAPEAAPELPPVPPEPAIEEALRRLDVLGQADLAVPATVKPFFTELADILRTYIERRVGVAAHEMTTGELVRGLQGRVPEKRIAEVDRLLRAADLVKFADVRPPGDRSRAALDATRLTVQRTEADLRPPAVSPAPEDELVPAAS